MIYREGLGLPVRVFAVVLTDVIDIHQQPNSIHVEQRNNIVVVIMVWEVAQKLLEHSSTIAKEFISKDGLSHGVAGSVLQA